MFLDFWISFLFHINNVQIFYHAKIYILFYEKYSLPPKLRKHKYFKDPNITGKFKSVIISRLARFRLAKVNNRTLYFRPKAHANCNCRWSIKAHKNYFNISERIKLIFLSIVLLAFYRNSMSFITSNHSSNSPRE